jgi:CHAT domain-containing protein
VTIIFAGCGTPHWQQLYDDSKLKLHQGYYDAAIREAADGYLKAQRKDVAWSWRFRILKAEGLMRNRMAEEAVALLAEDPPQNLPLEIIGRKWIVEGQALCRTNRRPEAQAILGKADRRISSEEIALKAELAFAHGSCLLSSPDIAGPYFEQAARLAHGTDPFLEASSVGNLGFLALAREHYDEAIDHLMQVLQITRRTSSPLLEEKALGNLGFSYSQLGDYRRAIDYSKQAAKVAAALGRLDDEEKWLLDLGHENDAIPGIFPGEAEASYSTALSLAKELGDAEVVHRCLHNLTQEALESHDLLKAEDYWRQEAATKAPESSFNEARIAVAKRKFSKAASIFRALLANRNISLVFRAAIEQQLGSVYWAENKTSQADFMFRKSLKTAERALAKVREDHRASFLDEYPFFDPYVRFLVSQGKTVQALELAERGRTAAQFSNLTASKKLDIRMVAAKLRKARQIILVYQVTNEESLLWVIAASQFKIFHLPRHGEFYSQIGVYNKEIGDHHDTLGSATGQKLFLELVQPAVNLIPKGSSVTIVPSKVLFGLSFEALVVPGADPHYWIDDVEIQVCSSLAAALSERVLARRKPPKEMLQIGAPLEANKDFPVLKYAWEEMDTITKRFSGKAQTITGKDATPQAYSSSSPKNYRLIHFVTHGTASETVPLESAIILSQQTDSSYKLYARDIVKTPLRADLVTISACYSAGTRWYQSEGLVGLAWAFLHAGAHQVVAGLWEVDDAATPQLMDHFYEGLQQGKSAAAALRSAKLKMLHSGTVYKHPFYWASLQLYTGR